MVLINFGKILQCDLQHKLGPVNLREENFIKFTRAKNSIGSYEYKESFKEDQGKSGKKYTTTSSFFYKLLMLAFHKK